MPKKIVTIIGARPQIIKAAAVSRAINQHFSADLTEVIVHTGQHYDENMSQVFFDELGIPAPNYNLQVGSGSHGKQTADMITGIEHILMNERPDFLLVYGDTNSTLAGSIAASKIHIPIVHVEAGLRSFNKAMPEEINRILCDHTSTLLFSPTVTGYNNLLKEGFKAQPTGVISADNPKIYHCGDVMYDNSLYFSELAKTKTTILQQLGLTENGFILATIHRNNNTDEPERLNALFKSLLHIAETENLPVVLPLHPRTNKLLPSHLDAALLEQVRATPHFHIIPPASFLEMIVLEQNCQMVMTDSGGVQKEAFFFQKPCIIFRHETEWTELVSCGGAKIVDANAQLIQQAFLHFKANLKSLTFPNFFGDGKAAEFICKEMLALNT